jgi:hypothetical protein
VSHIILKLFLTFNHIDIMTMNQPKQDTALTRDQFCANNSLLASVIAPITCLTLIKALDLQERSPKFSMCILLLGVGSCIQGIMTVWDINKTILEAGHERLREKNRQQEEPEEQGTQ